MVIKAINIKDLHFCYGDGTQALAGVHLEISAGEKVALLGPNGAGKSTLLLHFNGLNLPQQGEVFILGQKITSQNERWVRSKVGLVFQDPDDQLFAPTVWEDVLFGPLNLGLKLAEAELRAREALQAVGMLNYKDKTPLHLSFGQKKRVAIAGVLAMEPEIIVLDEPTAYLDPKGQEDLLVILDNLHDQGKTIIIATHDVDLVAEWAQSLIVLRSGTILAQGGVELLSSAEVVEKANLRYPVVTRLFKSIEELADVTPPVTFSQATALIKRLVADHKVCCDHE
ncbi:ATP-binding cassette domain-containing protein [Zhaonella formicivorans]|uniref:ATP-binding cassette domain-containing protein n=1 Tax=Zhaonella formicivorans TaxID=2528593 RepID=UPI0010F27ACA|nr:ATP-binding cassette domain-containing protein [Zhaonella formicivorans]